MTKSEIIDTLKTAIAEVEWNYPLNYAVAFEEAIERLQEYEPPARHGKWNRHNNCIGEYFTCGVCGSNAGYYLTRYCPECGAKMYKEENEDATD